MLKTGSPVLIVHRRLFEGDHSRYFVGKVLERDGAIVSVEGQTWIQDRFDGKFSRKDDLRTKILGLATDGLIIYALPERTNPQELKLDHSEGRLVLRDSGTFKMDLSELFHKPS